MQTYIVAGTDTEIGKTVFSAGLTHYLNARYWKPVQSGLDGETDSQIVARLGAVSNDRILPEAYKFDLPASPHLSAAAEGKSISPAALTLPAGPEPLVVELAGGLLVPLHEDFLNIDLLVQWQQPVILCARTRLGTINHTLLSLEALKARAVPVLGVAFVGIEEPGAEKTIAKLAGVPILGRLPHISPLTPGALQTDFAANFNRTDFEITTQ